MRIKFSSIILSSVLFLSVSAQEPREKQTLNFGWFFRAGDIEDVNAIDASAFGTLQSEGWQPVDLPHDYLIGQPWVPPAADEKADNTNLAANVKSRLSSRGFKEMGIGWYVRKLELSEAWKGRRVVLDFEGIMLVGDVYLNGERIGGTDYGYMGFEIDVTRKLKWGADNILAVKADTQNPNNSRWYTGGGLYRDVNIIVTDATQYFTRHPLYITTPVVEADRASVKVQAEMAYFNSPREAKEIKLNLKITDPTGKDVVDKTNTIPFNRRQRINEYRVDSLTIENPMLWDCDNPNLYTLQLTYLRPDGTPADVVTEQFGIRKFEFGPDFGLKLNGKKLLLKGIANHHTLGALGAAAYPKAIEKRLQLLKDYGFNHLRTSHNPYSESLMRLCDKYGIVVLDELYDKWTMQYAGGRVDWKSLWQHDIPEFVKRDRNRACVAFWSLGNELQQMWEELEFADWGVTPYKLQKELLLRYDDTRLVTVAMHPRYRDVATDSIPAPLARVTDIQSYNYRYMYFPGDGRRFPYMIFYQSEASMQAMGPNFYEMNLDKVVGLAYWGAIDYLGESNGWPTKGWIQGAFDISLEPKPQAYFMRSIFKPEEPIIHIGIVDEADETFWNDVKVGTDRMTDHWNRTPGVELKALYVYTNCDEVELFINGKSVGVKKNDKANPKARNRILWGKLKYEAGSVEAVGRNGGKAAARHKIETTGEAKKLVAQGDNDKWAADGQDLMHVRVCAVDGKGRVVKTATDNIEFSVQGPAEIVAVTNGDLIGDEMMTGCQRKLYNGTATVILRSKRGEAGQVTVTAKGAKLKEVKTEFATLKQ